MGSSSNLHDGLGLATKVGFSPRNYRIPCMSAAGSVGRWSRSPAFRVLLMSGLLAIAGLCGLLSTSLSATASPTSEFGFTATVANTHDLPVLASAPVGQDSPPESGCTNCPHDHVGLTLVCAMALLGSVPLALLAKPISVRIPRIAPSGPLFRNIFINLVRTPSLQFLCICRR